MLCVPLLSPGLVSSERLRAAPLPSLRTRGPRAAFANPLPTWPPPPRLSPTAASSEFSELWPVGNPADNPDSRRPDAPDKLFSGLAGDVALRRPTYAADWRLSSQKDIPTFVGATLFLYFACLAPVVAFGGAMQVATGGQLGIVETIISRGVCGMLYASLAGQPMTFIGPTGLTLAFTTALYAFVTPRGIPFLPMYTWVGLWTCGFLSLAACTNAANLIRYCTRFTEDVFNAFLGTSYLHSSATAMPALAVGSVSALSTSAFATRLAADAILFFLDQNITVRTVNSERNKLIPRATYHLDLAFADADRDGSGEVTADELVALLRRMSEQQFSRPMSLEQAATMAADAFRGFDGNDTCRLGLEEASLEFADWFKATGLDSNPAAAVVSPSPLAPPPESAPAPEQERVLETRLSGFTIHAMVPVAVVNGVFLYLGKKVMTGNQFLQRVRALAVPLPSNLRAEEAAERSILVLGRRATAIFTGLQLACLVSLWKLKLTPGLGMVFPAAIGVLMFIRVQILPRLFTFRQLGIIDTPISPDIRSSQAASEEVGEEAE
ncbi:tentative Ca2+ interacting HCO3-transporter [Emiliania huxleyi CCMP1516]|uniref:EF-hand domain-containing protein n=2 Tax=Emiliania huxleyi TaxID=2903 RepID=A0A0D3JF48_EMIH1|nr:tentative Ca2+ interacting HCO3-transporter [Emiliania huxleyi CCMP1516]EOD22133.1 tentative Ca2+ interacting HCO3-transporter [Emiliania huxleyi CCMP1516]|eukprot:XP_005774562.1 tentative Ca2+ interacting HCO3-transporter [Emiliania huxleyi CCMP1516]